ncbi:hypothetical protein ACROYT_G019021 [Oculina patagonica]
MSWLADSSPLSEDAKLAINCADELKLARQQSQKVYIQQHDLHKKAEPNRRYQKNVISFKRMRTKVFACLICVFVLLAVLSPECDAYANGSSKGEKIRWKKIIPEEEQGTRRDGLFGR